jgi:hypothetical protein
VSEKSYEKRVKVPAHSIPEARHLAARWRAGRLKCKNAIANGLWVYTAVAQDAKMEISVYRRTIR